MRAPLFAFAFVVVANFATSRAAACIGPSCKPLLYPRGGFGVPANATTFMHFDDLTSGRLDNPYTLSLIDESDGIDIAVTTAQSGPPQRSAVTFTRALEEGHRYVFHSTESCLADHDQTIRVGAAAPFPTTLGTLTQSAPFRANIDARGGVSYCRQTAGGVAVRVQAALSEDATPWEGLLVYEAVVDGEPFVGFGQGSNEVLQQGETYAGFGVVDLASVCQAGIDYSGESYYARDFGLREGTHDVYFRATIAGTEVSFETPPIGVTLRCTDVFVADEIDNSNMTPNSSCSTVAATGAPRSGAAVSLLALTSLAFLGRAWGPGRRAPGRSVK